MAVDTRKQIDVIAIDFSKAFNEVLHKKKLIYKLEAIGLD